MLAIVFSFNMLFLYFNMTCKCISVGVSELLHLSVYLSVYGPVY